MTETDNSVTLFALCEICSLKRTFDEVSAWTRVAVSKPTIDIVPFAEAAE
jgi:hypothetical protein